MNSHDSKFVVSIVISGIIIGLYVLDCLSIFPYIQVLLGIAIVFGIGYSIVSCYIRNNSSIDGIMIVDKSDPAKDIYRMVLNDNIAELTEKNIVSFEVHNAGIIDDEG